MMQASDAAAMAHALSLGRRGLGRVWPNPAVGCVIVNDGRIVGRGWTRPGGRPHAETVALAQAGDAARGATAFVTLEPCAHHGRTPPCAVALIAAGVARVVSAMEDPDPRTAGAGHARLRSAGIDVDTGKGAAAAAADHAGFVLRITAGRPMVTLKLATSLDGRIATSGGASRWITGPSARRAVHAMRATHDAVLVGGGTARTDDPMLTVRGMGDMPQPVRIVASAGADIAPGGRLARSAAEVPLWILHAPMEAVVIAGWTAAGVRMIEVASPRGRPDPAAMLQALGAAGLTRVLCEGGGTLAAALLRAGLVDRIVTFCAGLAIGSDGLPGMGGLGLADLAAAPRFRLHSVRDVGGDAMMEWRRQVPRPTAPLAPRRRVRVS